MVTGYMRGDFSYPQGYSVVAVQKTRLRGAQGLIDICSRLASYHAQSIPPMLIDLHILRFQNVSCLHSRQTVPPRFYLWGLSRSRNVLTASLEAARGTQVFLHLPCLRIYSRPQTPLAIAGVAQANCLHRNLDLKKVTFRRGIAS